MIIPSEILEQVNATMLGRGAPVERDNFGYNIPDFNKLSSIWMGASKRDLFAISSRLIKYYDTQLEGIDDFNFTKDDLMETADYYRELTENTINKPSVTIGFNNDYTVAHVSFKYNNDFICVCRDFKYRFTRASKTWFGDSKTVLALLENLQEVGADAENAIKIVTKLTAMDIIPFDTPNGIEESTKEKLEVIEKNDNEVILKFDYNPNVVQAIKSLDFRQFDWNDKTWTIHKFDIAELYKNLDNLNMDLSELEAYLNDDVPPPKIEVIEVKDLDVKIGFPYIKQIVDSIKELDYCSYNSTDKTWVFDIRQADILINKIKDVINVSELEELEKPEEKPVIKLRDYTYLKRKPYAHQYTAAEFLLNKRKAILADEMGGGKTLSSIMAAYSLSGPRLVVCPASLKLNWAKEIEMVDADGQIHIIRDKGIDEKADWNIINYDILEKYFDELNEVDWEVIIFDEAHYMKAVSNGGKPDSKRADYGIQLGLKSPYVFSLTGTPITNRPKDVFNLLKLSDHILAKNFFNFAQNYCGATHNGWGWNFNGSSNEEELHRKIKPYMLRRLKKDMLDLPEKVRRFIPVEINLREYSKIVAEYMEQRPHLKNRGEHLVYLTTMKHLLAQAKSQHSIEIAKTIVDAGKSVVIFTCYEKVVQDVLKAFKKNVVKITGKDSDIERQEAVEQFQAGEKQVMVANIIAGGVGLTLIEAKQLIFNDFDWVPANHLQAEDRIHRIGQDEITTVNYVYAKDTEIDEYMSGLLEEKADAINEIIDGGLGEDFTIEEKLISLFG